MAICPVDIGITLTRKDVATVDHSVVIESIIRKVNLSGVRGDTFYVRVENTPTGTIAKQTVGTTENGCGVKEYNVCACDEMDRLVMKVNNRFNCANRYNRCLSSIVNEVDETQLKTTIMNEDAYRQRRLAENVKSSLNKAVISEIASAGVPVTPQLVTATATLEQIIAALQDVSDKFDAQGYPIPNRYVMLDPVLFNKLVQGANNNIGCCANIIVVQGNVLTLDFMGMKVVKAVSLEALYGVNLLAIHGDYVILGTKCGSNENGVVEVKVKLDNTGFKDANTEVEYDLYKAEYIYGLTFIQEAIMISGTPLLKASDKKVEDNVVETP